MKRAAGKNFARPRIVHPYAWLWEPLEAEPTFLLRAMFGAKAVYLDGRIVLCFCATEEPWRGLLVCTDRERHAALQAEIGELIVHPILTKWLYLPERVPTFERTAARLVGLVRRRDSRIGVIPKPKSSRRTTARRARPPGHP